MKSKRRSGDTPTWRARLCALPHGSVVGTASAHVLGSLSQDSYLTGHFGLEKKVGASKFEEFETVRIIKKTTKFWPKNITQIKKSWERSTKKEKRRKPSKTPSFFFLVSFSFVFIWHHHLHKNKKVVNNLPDVPVLFQHPLQSWDYRKNYLPSPPMGTQNYPPWTPTGN